MFDTNFNMFKLIWPVLEKKYKPKRNGTGQWLFVSGFGACHARGVKLDKKLSILVDLGIKLFQAKYLTCYHFF